MGRLRLFGELIEAGGAVEGGGGGGGGGGGHQIARVVRTAGDYMTTSTSFVDIDTNNLVINLTTGASWVWLLLTGSIYVSSLQYSCFDFTIDGVRQGQAKGVQQVQAVYVEDIQIALARGGDGGKPRLPAPVARHRWGGLPAGQQRRDAPPLRRAGASVGEN
jgi:hypothetical protein